MSAWDGLIKRYRMINGLTQAALAEVLGVEQATISRWERGNHTPDLSIQRKLRDLISATLRNDCIVYHRIRCSLMAVKLADRNGRNHAASLNAAMLHGVTPVQLQHLDYRVLFTDVLEQQWREALTVGFFRGEIASVTVVNPWRPAGIADLRYSECCWTPAMLSDGEILLVSEIHQIDEASYLRVRDASPMRITAMDDLLR
ncbi:helix-turn-helix transcriptional regulator [Microvirga massiliensis]|uniref:helix-turn-helix transcriptional regulator n=1 Tax=Microvirga massiliensis TaxID=1033741 RepID=UPI00062B5CE9|nr:helix-turn-helix transcriptional regulator [Microvirga massiliensis]